MFTMTKDEYECKMLKIESLMDKYKNNPTITKRLEHSKEVVEKIWSMQQEH